jgi:plasmid stability protein
MHSALVHQKERPTTVTILVDRELRARLERAAAENDRSLGAEVRHLLRRHLEGDDEQEGEAA